VLSGWAAYSIGRGGGRGIANELVTQRAQSALGIVHSARGAVLGIVDGARCVAHRVRLVRDAGCVAHLVGNHIAEALLCLGLGHRVVSHNLNIRCTRRSSLLSSGSGVLHSFLEGGGRVFLGEFVSLVEQLIGSLGGRGGAIPTGASEGKR
jgi:hypothetical protein